MKLSKLDPRWLLRDGERIGFVFQSPTLGSDLWMAVCEATPPRQEIWPIIRAAFPEGWITEKGFARNVQTMNSTDRWQVGGGLGDASFDTLTVTPSVDGSSIKGNWHGFITDGEIVGGI